jgi:outer membrane usher protein
VRLGQYGTLHLAVIREQAQRASTSGFLTFTRAIGSRSSFESVAERNGGRAGQRDDLRAAFTHSTPQSEGLGWRLGATRSGNYDAWLQQRTAVADIEYQAARNFGVNGQSLQVRGAATWLDGKLQAARAVDGSFAIVDVAGLADVPVYVENQLVTRTDRNGRALLHNLLSYEANRISIEPLDLPLNTSIAQRTLTLRPGYRSGIVARFPVERISPGVFRLLQVDGTPVPAGAAVEFNGGRYTVAMDGFTYVTTLDHGLAGSASWNGGACAFRVEPPPSDDPLPDMGEVLCRTGTGVAP